MLLATLTAIKGRPVPIDLCSITQMPSHGVTDSNDDPVRTLSFLSTAFGLMADLDVGTDNWRWMGETRFVLGYIKGALQNSKQNCRLDVLLVEQDKLKIEQNWIEQRNQMKDASAYSTTPSPAIPPVDSSLVDGEHGGLPSLLYGDVRTPISKRPLPSPQTSKLSPDTATDDQWYTLEEPITSIYAGTLPFMSADLLEFPMKLSGDGSIDIIVHQSPSALRTLRCIDGAEKGSMFLNDDVSTDT